MNYFPNWRSTMCLLNANFSQTFPPCHQAFHDRVDMVHAREDMCIVFATFWCYTYYNSYYTHIITVDAIHSRSGWYWLFLRYRYQQAFWWIWRYFTNFFFYVIKTTDYDQNKVHITDVKKIQLCRCKFNFWIVFFKEWVPSGAEIARRYKEHCDADPDRRRKYLKKESDKWNKDRETGKKKGVNELSERREVGKKKEIEGGKKASQS